MCKAVLPSTHHSNSKCRSCVSVHKLADGFSYPPHPLNSFYCNLTFTSCRRALENAVVNYYLITALSVEMPCHIGICVQYRKRQENLENILCDSKHFLPDTECSQPLFHSSVSNILD